MLLEAFLLLSSSLSSVSSAFAALSSSSTLSNAFISLSFDDSIDSASFGLPSFFGRPSGENLLTKSPISLWSAEVVTPTAVGALTISPASPCVKRSVQATTSSFARLLWSGITVNNQPSVDVELNISLVNASVYLQLGFQTTNQVSLWTWTVTAGEYSLPPSASLVFNEGFGVIQNCSLGCEGDFSGVYPSLTYQFLAAYGLNEEGQGVYVGAHDATGAAKTFGSHVEAGAVRFHISATPPGAGVGNITHTVMNYPLVIALFEGDWFDAATIYRDWVLPSSSWATKGPLSGRSDFPQWLPAITTWVNSHWQQNDIFNVSGGDPALVSSRMSAIVKRFGLDKDALALHWYEWDLLGYEYGSNYSKCATEITCGFDTHYPEYFPPREGFQQGLQQIQQLGVRVTPYINGRIFDQATKTWSQDKAVAFASKLASPQTDSRNLSLYNEQYGSKAEFAVMCPFTTYWQHTIASVVDTLVNQYHTDGVYIDQIAAAGPRNCFDPTHNHSIGGGDHWVSGYRSMLRSARSLAGNQSLLLTESNSEPYMDGVDLYLTLVAFNAPFAGHTHSAPVFQSIYGGYVFLGGAMFYQNDFTVPDVFASKIARQFVFGAQMGWFSLGGRDNQVPPMGIIDYLLSSDYTPEIDFLRLLSAAKKVGIPYLVYGRALRSLPILINGSLPSPQLVKLPRMTAVDEEDQRSRFEEQDPSFNAVENSAWLGTNSSVLLAFVTVQRADSAKIDCNLDMRDFGFPLLDPQATVTLTRVFPDYVPVGTFASAKVVVATTMAPRSVELYRVSLN